MKDYRSEDKFGYFRNNNSVSTLKNDEISFALLIKLWTLYAVSMKSIR